MAGDPIASVVAFLRVVLRDTWPALAATLCAVLVDDLRPRGPCGTHLEVLAVPALVASLFLSAATIGLMFMRLVHRRDAAVALSTAVNAYAVAVTLYLALPYA